MIEFTIISGLIILNALFVAAEFAIVGAPRSSIDARAAAGNRLAQMVQRVLHDPQRQDRYIATAQLGITVASLGLGMYGEHVLADGIYNLLGRTGGPAWLVSHGLASVTAIAILTYFHIVVGEMVPKSLALQRAEQMSLTVTPIMQVITTLVYPFVVILNGVGNRILKVFGVRRQAETPEQVLHARGTAAHRAGERRARRHQSRIGPDATGALRVRRPHRRGSDGAARAHHRDSGRQQAREGP